MIKEEVHRKIVPPEQLSENAGDTLDAFVANNDFPQAKVEMCEEIEWVEETIKMADETPVEEVQWVDETPVR